MATNAANTVVKSILKDWKTVDSRYIRPELYTLKKPLNTILLTLAALTAYPQIIGQDRINCMPHEFCDNATNVKCSTREDGYTIADLSYNQKLYIDDDCRKTHMSQYRFYLLYILISVASLSIIIQRLWKTLPSHNVFVCKFLKIVEECEKDIGMERLLSKIHMPRKDDSGLSESQIEENIQVMEHLLHFDDDLQHAQKQELINLVDRAIDLKTGHDGESFSLNMTSVLSTGIHFILSIVFLVASNILEAPVFQQEFLCQHPSFQQSSNRMLCVDLQATFLTVIRFLFHFILLILTVSKLIMELRVQFIVHATYNGNVQKIQRYKILDGKDTEKKHRNLLFLMVCLKLYNQNLFNRVSLLMSEQMQEVRRRQKTKQLVRHLQTVVRGGKLGCVRHFIRQLRLMHVPDTDGSLQDIVAECGDVEVNLTEIQLKQFRSCVNAVMLADDGQNMAALHRSVDSGQPEVVEHLILAGADVNVRDAKQETPLHKAMRNGSTHIVEVLMRQKADFKATNKDGKTPVEVASQKNQLWDMLCLTVRAGNDMELIKTFLDAGVDVHAVRQDVGSLLHVAVHKNSSRIVRILLDRGCKLELRDSRDRTPLQLAVFGASLKVVKLLVEAGADLSATTTEEGETVNLLDLAKENERSAVREYLLKVLQERKQPEDVHDPESDVTDDESLGRYSLA